MTSAVFAISPKSMEDGSWERMRRQLAQLEGVGLFPARAFVSLVHPDLYPYPLSYYQEIKYHLRHQVHDELKGELHRAAPFRPLHVLVSPTSERYGLVERLSDFTRRRRASVLVISHEPRRGFFQRLVSSIAEAAVETAEVPVLVLKDEIPRRRDGPYILFAVDHQRPPSQRAIRWVVRAARLVKRGVRVLEVRQPPNFFSRWLEKATPGATSTLSSVVRAIHQAGVQASGEMVEGNGSVARTLAAYAKSHGLGMVIVTSPRRTLLRRLLVPSTTKKLLRACELPLLVLRLA